MKKTITLLLAAIALAMTACSDPYEIPTPKPPVNNEGNGGNTGNNGGNTDKPQPDPDIKKVPTLQTDARYWQIDSIKPGMILYTFSGTDKEITNSKQNINVLEIDMASGKYAMEFKYDNAFTITSKYIHAKENVASVNACYEPESVYIKIDGKVISETDPKSTSGWYCPWKCEAAFVSDTGYDMGIVMTKRQDHNYSVETYKKMEQKNIFASAPMLIQYYEPVGETCVDPSLTQEEINKLNQNDYNSLCGIRHPRTVFAYTEDKDLLLITIDGRQPGFAEGMTAKEETQFIAKHFNPQYAINMDGGGSTSMCVKNSKIGMKNTWLVNYPCNENRSERNVKSHLVIVEK